MPLGNVALDGWKLVFSAFWMARLIAARSSSLRVLLVKVRVKLTVTWSALKSNSITLPTCVEI